MSPYPYAGRNLFEQPEYYHYARCNQADFLATWRASRAAFAEALKLAEARQVKPASSDDGPIADQLRRALQEMHAAHDVPPSVSELLDRLVHKYEVSRRIYRYYDDGWRRNADAPEVAPGAYLLLAQALVEYCRWRPAALQPLSTLLKLCDALTSLGGSAYTDDERAILASVLASERDFIIAMAGGAST